MKTIMSVFLLYPVLLQIATCNPSYYCGRQCYAYRNDSITICQTTPANSGPFAKSVDSLNQIYGAGTGFYADSVTVDGTSTNAENSVVSQLEKQGYTCSD